MDDLLIRLSNGTRVYTPPSLSAITTYVLLEQETWFEKEFSFLPHILKHGMTAIDIGANLGIFSTAMAQLVGPTGSVFAYEPTSETRARLARTRTANSADNLTIVGKALSDGERSGTIVFGGSSELNHLGSDAEGESETVEISSLDLEGERLRWNRPDFIKIDAEGEEIPILKGGSRLFGEGSPLVMLEAMAGAEFNHGLIEAMQALGYRTYRLLAGAPILVPLVVGKVDGYELNFFAAKPDKVAELAAQGLLVENTPTFAPSDNDGAAALAELRRQPFAAAFPAQFAEDAQIHPQYLRALTGYGVWRDANRHAPERWSALRDALATLRALCETEGTMARLSTFARIAADGGARVEVQTAIDPILKGASNGPVALGEPFWPPSPRYDRLDLAGKPAQWFLAAASEQLEIQRSYSTAFAAPSSTLNWLCTTTFASVEMQRRRSLNALRSGQTTEVSDVLLRNAPDHVNADLWRNGTVAGLAPKPAA